MYEITTESSFSAAHYLADYNGPCENLHGHNWLVKASVRCEGLNRIGIGVDFKVLRGALRGICDELDHKELNQALKAHGKNPSCENIARHVYERLRAALAGEDCRVHKVEVFETPGNSATYFEQVRLAETGNLAAKARRREGIRVSTED